ncbi:epoxide hydrolase family protein [Microbacterium sp. X-17]|uniref:epoxide hydrolase family protein n=1 Tax=Microbacterium sp. X-17 TaxID=3144404 RepID=UPI0031F5BBA1
MTSAAASLRIAFDPAGINDLKSRLHHTRLPVPHRPDIPGPKPSRLREFCQWWATEFRWERSQNRINQIRHLTVRTEHCTLHFTLRAETSQRVPILLLHGWLSSFLEFERIAPLLALDRPVLTASLPGHGLSTRPARLWTTRDTAGALVEALTVLGYPSVIAHGTDFGSAVATWMALDAPEHVRGLHLSNLELSPSPADSDLLTDTEADYLAAADQWWKHESGYKTIQSTRPGALSPALMDSPAGLAAWVLDRWDRWTDPALGVDAFDRVGRTPLAELLTFMWMTGSIETSILDYLDNAAAGSTRLPPASRIRVPTAIAHSPRLGTYLERPPDVWAKRMYNLVDTVDLPKGGHFAALEVPDLLAAHIRQFANGLD